MNLIYETLGCARKCFVDFNAGRTKFVSFDQCNNTGDFDMKMDESVLEEKSYFKMLGLTFSYKLNGVFTLSLLLKLPPRRLKS